MKENLKCHVKVGDQVKIITGDNKGTIGTIESILFKKAVLFIKEIQPRLKSVKNTQGGETKKIERPIPIHFSNVFPQLPMKLNIMRLNPGPSPLLTKPKLLSRAQHILVDRSIFI